MLILVAAAALLLCLDGTAHGQVDTTRPRPAPARGIQPLPTDPGDIESIEIIKMKWPVAVDRLGAAERRKMLETLEAQRRVWADRRPRTYMIRTVTIGHCIFIAARKGTDGELLTDQLVVRDTAVV